MGQKDMTEYLPPFHAPRLNKWVLMERGAAAKARAGAPKIHLYLFDNQATAELFYWAYCGASPAVGAQLH